MKPEFMSIEQRKFCRENYGIMSQHVQAWVRHDLWMEDFAAELQQKITRLEAETPQQKQQKYFIWRENQRKQSEHEASEGKAR